MPALQTDYSRYIHSAAEQRARAKALRTKWKNLKKVVVVAPAPMPSATEQPAAGEVPAPPSFSTTIGIDPDFIGPPCRPRPFLRYLLADVARQYGLPPDVLLARGRMKELVRIRNEFIYRAAAETHHSVSAIGKFIGRDHSTILHSIQKYCHDNGLPHPRGGSVCIRSRARAPRP